MLNLQSSQTLTPVLATFTDVSRSLLNGFYVFGGSLPVMPSLLTTSMIGFKGAALEEGQSELRAFFLLYSTMVPKNIP